MEECLRLTHLPVSSPASHRNCLPQWGTLLKHTSVFRQLLCFSLLIHPNLNFFQKGTLELFQEEYVTSISDQWWCLARHAPASLPLGLEMRGAFPGGGGLYFFLLLTAHCVFLHDSGVNSRLCTLENRTEHLAL